MKLAAFLQKAYSVLNRLDLVLPEEPGKTDWNALAYRWHMSSKEWKMIPNLLFILFGILSDKYPLSKGKLVI